MDYPTIHLAVNGPGPTSVISVGLRPIPVIEVGVLGNAPRGPRGLQGEPGNDSVVPGPKGDDGDSFLERTGTTISPIEAGDAITTTGTVTAGEFVGGGAGITGLTVAQVAGALATETDPKFTAWDKATGILITENQVTDLKAYLTTETDPEFTASPAHDVTATDITNLGKLDSAAYEPTTAFAPALGSDDNFVTDTEKGNLHAPGSDDQNLDGLVVKVPGSSLVPDTDIARIHDEGSDIQNLDHLVVKVDGSSLVPDSKIAEIHAPGSDDQNLDGLVEKVLGMGLSANDYTDSDKNRLANTSGTNTGDQNLSAYALKTELPVVPAETDPVFTAWDKSTGITINEVQITNLKAYLVDDDITGKADLTGATFTGDISATNLSGTNTGNQDLSALATVSSVALKADKSVTYTELEGAALVVSPSGSYTATLGALSTIEGSGWTAGSNEACTIVITKAADMAIEGAGSGAQAIVIKDVPEVGVNICMVHNTPDGLRLFVGYTEEP